MASKISRISPAIRAASRRPQALPSLPPTFLLPIRNRLIHSTSPIVESTPVPEPPTAALKSQQPKSTTPNVSQLAQHPPSGTSPTSTAPIADLPSPTSQSPSTPTTPLSDSVKSLLPLLKAQPPYYITIHIHGKPYLITTGDTIRLPFLMHGVRPGDVLRLNRATTLGSRDYTLKAGATVEAASSKADRAFGGVRTSYLDERLFECRAVVMGTEAEPMRVKEKTKRRNRRVKHVFSKHKYTILRVREVKVRGVEEVEAGGQ